MSNIQKVIYEAIEDMAIKRLEQNSITDLFRRSALIRMRQAASNPKLLIKPIELYYDDEVPEQIDDKLEVDKNILNLIVNYKEVPCKFIEALRLSQRIIEDGGKLIIWCEFVGTCIDLCTYLDENGVHNAILYGGTAQDEREKIINDFHNDSSLSVIIANPHAVGESISLHKACHNALYLEQGYNAGVYMQSKDRIHRVGLKEGDETNYFYFHAAGTVDAVAYERVINKERRMIELIESEEIPLLSMNKDFMDDTEDDIKAVLRAYYERRNQRI